MAFHTYEEATSWLATIGGDIVGPNRTSQGSDKVIVHIPGHGLQRTGLIENSLTGAAYDAARRRAVTHACNQFKAAGAKRLAKGK